MSLKPCLACGELTSGSYCPSHHPDLKRKRVTPGRRQAPEFREKVLKRDGSRCRALMADGTRCLVTDRLEAHHLLPVVRGGTDALPNGVTLCLAHHRRAEREAWF